MVTNTALGIFYVPIFFVLMTWIFSGRRAAGAVSPVNKGGAE